MDRQTADRQMGGGIELLKVIAMFLIVLSHVIYTIRTDNVYIDAQYGYIINLSLASSDFQVIVLQILRSAGIFANNIFWIASCWFLVDINKNNNKKCIYMLLQTWIVSVVITAVYIIINQEGRGLPNSLLVNSVFPISRGHYWYLTCYLLVYPFHKYINMIIDHCDKWELFRLCFFSTIIYCGICFVRDGLFFFNRLVLFVVIYFVVGYVKRYMLPLANNVRINRMVFILSLLLYCLFHIGLNILGLRVNFFKNKMMTWSVVQDPFLIICAICLFNVFRLRSYKKLNKYINYISSSAMLVYIIHEQPLLGQLCRPVLVEYCFLLWGKRNIIIVSIFATIVILILSLVAVIIYRLTLDRVVVIVSNRLYAFLQRMFNKIEQRVVE